ncbi:MAG: alkaline shock response membrane anchor protein AmaP [Clostridiales bacterium]|nr:alkaline shock response membrane anchor protein AmaP [Clostridiales bacterium]
MKQSLVDRVLTGLAGLILAVLGLGLFVYGVGIFPFQLDMAFLEGPFTFWQHMLMVAVALVLLLLGVRGVLAVFRSNKEKGFILQRTEYGDLNISMNAMENMVKKVVDMNDELKVNHTKISHTKDGVIVAVRILLENGVNIPMVVSALQKQTRQYITSCSGVDVKEVRVYVDTSAHVSSGQKGDNPSGVAADAEAVGKAGRMVDRLNDAVQKAIQSDAAPKRERQPEDAKEPLHQRIFRKKEQEHTEEKAVENTEETADEAKEEKAPKTTKKKAAAKPAGDPHDREDA